ncbi:MAG TPA: thioesterase family protein [Syntrophorhabdaceae bacterium]|nr:thioesterase family protein [Syntrophorhabdaceae bacterium]
MSEIILYEQNAYDFQYKLQIQIGHINYAGHVGHEAIIAILWEARTHVFRTLGIGELDLGDGKTGIIMKDLVVNFYGEAFLFDEITVESYIGDMKKNGFRIYYKILKNDKKIAIAETGFLTYDYKHKKVVPVPSTFLLAIEKYKRDKLKV